MPVAAFMPFRMDLMRDGRGLENWISSLEWYSDLIPRLRTSTWSDREKLLGLGFVVALVRAPFFLGGILELLPDFRQKSG
jgi:hypothetical protein